MQRFGGTLERAAKGELAYWRISIRGRLAEIIVLDQFSRNVWRDTPALPKTKWHWYWLKKR